MALQPLSIGDILMLSQTAWKIGRAFANGKKSAPAEFAEVEREANGLSDALKLVAEALHTDNSILALAEEETKNAVNTILESAHKTLSDLESFVDRYQIIRKQDTQGGFVVERSWSKVVMANYKTFKWTTEGGDITALRDMLQMHTNSLNLTMQALQSRSLARLEKTVVPMAENITSIYERVNGDLGDKITELHALIMSLANSRAPSVREQSAIEDATLSISSGSGTPRNSIGGQSTALIEGSPVSNMSYYHGNHYLRPADASLSRPPSSEVAYRPLNRTMSHETPTQTPAITQPHRSSREDSAVGTFSPISLDRDIGSSMRHDDFHFESGSPDERQPSICSENLPDRRHPDSGYLSLSSASRPTSHVRKESNTVPSHLNRFKMTGDHGDAGEGSSAAAAAASAASGVSPRAKRNSWNVSSNNGSPPLPPPAWPHEEAIEEDDHVPETPSSLFFPKNKRAAAETSPVFSPKNNFDNPVPSRPPSLQTVVKPSAREPSFAPPEVGGSVYSEANSFEQQLFRNSAILCDVRGKLLEYAQTNPDEPDPRFNVEMVEACKDARICVVRKRENREHGGTRVVTSIWCLSDDGEQRIQLKLSEINETVPFCSYFEPEKVSLQPTAAEGLRLKFHNAHWGAMLLDDRQTTWVNYYFASANDAVAFQSAVFGRLLIGSYRTTKTTVIHDGLKGAFAFEEQFANIEMLRLWEDDGVTTPGAAGGVLALMHISSSFGEGWARWWINSSLQQVRVKEDGLRHAKVKGIDITVVKPRPVPSSNERGRRPTGEALQRVETNVPADVRAQKKSPFKRVNGIRIEFRTEEERSQFVSMIKRVQQNSLPLPDL